MSGGGLSKRGGTQEEVESRGWWLIPTLSPSLGFSVISWGRPPLTPKWARASAPKWWSPPSTSRFTTRKTSRDLHNGLFPSLEVGPLHEARVGVSWSLAMTPLLPQVLAPSWRVIHRLEWGREWVPEREGIYGARFLQPLPHYCHSWALPVLLPHLLPFIALKLDSSKIPAQGLSTERCDVHMRKHLSSWSETSVSLGRSVTCVLVIQLNYLGSRQLRRTMAE